MRFHFFLPPIQPDRKHAATSSIKSFAFLFFFVKSWIYQKDQGEKCRALGLWKKMKMLVREYFLGEKDSI